jgi:hypothetical protein
MLIRGAFGITMGYGSGWLCMLYIGVFFFFFESDDNIRKEGSGKYMCGIWWAFLPGSSP